MLTCCRPHVCRCVPLPSCLPPTVTPATALTCTSCPHTCRLPCMYHLPPTLSFHLLTHLPVHLPVCPFTCLSTHPWAIFPPMCLPLCSPRYLPLSLPTHLPVHPANLPTHPLTYLYFSMYLLISGNRISIKQNNQLNSKKKKLWLQGLKKYKIKYKQIRIKNVNTNECKNGLVFSTHIANLAYIHIVCLPD